MAAHFVDPPDILNGAPWRIQLLHRFVAGLSSRLWLALLDRVASAVTGLGEILDCSASARTDSVSRAVPIPCLRCSGFTTRASSGGASDLAAGLRSQTAPISDPSFS